MSPNPDDAEAIEAWLDGLPRCKHPVGSEHRWSAATDGQTACIKCGFAVGFDSRGLHVLNAKKPPHPVSPKL